MTTTDFDIDAFLAQPLTARVATNGPTVRPTWYLWEDQAFWILTGPWAKLLNRVRTDPTLALTVDVCDISTGFVQQVIARGHAEVLPFDVPRGRRKLSRYLGHDEAAWDPRFRHYLHDSPAEHGTVWLRLHPSLLTATDLSYDVQHAPETRLNERDPPDKNSIGTDTPPFPPSNVENLRQPPLRTVGKSLASRPAAAT